mmetsp:Transcript_128176/g.410816  ORF Transcript_128176/g.410816 Transcript_128176/m.410816 type:complete len:151 (+) Transcript_128176:95-547(+)
MGCNSSSTGNDQVVDPSTTKWAPAAPASTEAPPPMLLRAQSSGQLGVERMPPASKEEVPPTLLRAESSGTLGVEQTPSAPNILRTRSEPALRTSGKKREMPGQMSPSTSTSPMAAMRTGNKRVTFNEADKRVTFGGAEHIKFQVDCQTRE